MFQYQSTANIIFGWGVAEAVGAEVKKYGSRALIVTGGSSTKNSGLLERTMRLLEEEGISWVLFDKVTSNPLVSTVMEGAALLNSEGCDVVLGLGGGSSMDAAKAISLMALSGGEPEDYTFGRRTVERALPMVMVPTTCGTGSEVNGISVLSNEHSKDKKAVASPHLIARASLIDPQLMTTMPREVYASVAFDALAHLMEGYLTTTSNPMSDCYTIRGMELMRDHMVRVYENSAGREGWEAVTWASTLGGLSIHAAGLFAPHGLEHPLSGLRNVAHGKGLAAITPAIFQATLPQRGDRFAHISRIFGGKDETDCPQAVKNLLKSLDLCLTLQDLGFTNGDLDWLADNCIKVGSKNLQKSPVVFDRSQVRALYETSLTFNER